MKSGQKWQATFFFCCAAAIRATRAQSKLTPMCDVCDSASVCVSHTISSVHAIVTCGDVNEYIRSIYITLHHIFVFSCLLLSIYIFRYGIFVYAWNTHIEPSRHTHTHTHRHAYTQKMCFLVFRFDRSALTYLM